MGRVIEQKLMELGEAKLRELYPTLYFKDFEGNEYDNISSFAFYLAGTGIAGITSQLERLGAFITEFDQLSEDHDVNTLCFIHGLTSKFSVLSAEERKVVAIRFTQVGGIWDALSALGKRLSEYFDGEINMRVNIGGDYDQTLGNYLAAKGMTAAEAKDRSLGTQIRILEAVKTMYDKGWSGDEFSEVFIFGLMEQVSPKQAVAIIEQIPLKQDPTIELFNDLNNRLQNLTVEPDAEAAKGLLKWVQDGGLESLKLTLTAFLDRKV